jgi:hypothetical protein
MDGLKTRAVYTIKGDKASYLIEYITRPVATIYLRYLPIGQKMINSFEIVANAKPATALQTIATPPSTTSPSLSSSNKTNTQNVLRKYWKWQ